MMDYRDIPMKAEAVRALMEDRLGIKSRDLGHAMRKGRRLLPRAMRKQGAVLVAADRAARSPKTARQINREKVLLAYEVLTNHLRAINVNAQRRDRILRLAGGIAFQILLLGVAFVVYLWWRGLV
ncbi:hypothetical protein [Sulfitobacter sp. JB4-11]|uniref:hypothetical protein n=1 Tax=Sulfitobacter rhodophyticola TaxID=3238304 RepID=UPI003516C357